MHDAVVSKPGSPEMAGDPHFAGGPEDVLQVERRDFTALVPTDRPRRQSMRGFDPIYTDIVDYIVRCTHRIWDERDVGLIYTHYTHNAVLYTATGAIYSREEVIHDTIQRLVTFPERRGLATQVIWRGNDEEGFYTSHYVTGAGRHTQPGMYGKPTGRAFHTRTVADCLSYENKIYREWMVTDSMGLIKQLGLDPHAVATTRARSLIDKAQMVDIGEIGRLHGQMPPEAEPDLTLAHDDLEADCLKSLHEIYNRRMFGRIRDWYAPNVQWHGPLMKEVYGRAGVVHQALALVGSIPDCIFTPQHICSVPSEEGGTKVAVRWVMEGHNTGWGLLGEPSGKRLFVMGMTHLHLKEGRVVEDWTLYDELALLTQIKMAEMAA